jgi:hypothetical protein
MLNFYVLVGGSSGSDNEVEYAELPSAYECPRMPLSISASRAFQNFFLSKKFTSLHVSKTEQCPAILGY